MLWIEGMMEPRNWDFDKVTKEYADDAILKYLSKRQCSVGSKEIARSCVLHYSKTTYSLARLVEAGKIYHHGIIYTKAGGMAYYGVNPAQAHEIVDLDGSELGRSWPSCRVPTGVIVVKHLALKH
jgi:hypothetical protein